MKSVICEFIKCGCISHLVSFKFGVWCHHEARSGIARIVFMKEWRAALKCVLCTIYFKSWRKFEKALMFNLSRSGLVE